MFPPKRHVRVIDEDRNYIRHLFGLSYKFVKFTENIGLPSIQCFQNLDGLPAI